MPQLPEALSPHRPPSVEALGARLSSADAIVIVTPEYNHSFPAPLKSAIDWYSSEWLAKPVGYVSYCGMAGGLRNGALRVLFGLVDYVNYLCDHGI